MTTRSVLHDTFVIEREVTAPPSRAFDAFANLDKKRRWFGDPNDTTGVHELDFRVDGKEHAHGTVGEGTRFAYDAVYRDIVPEQRIIYSYDMRVDDVRISVSVATVQFLTNGNGTRVVLTEQGVYLDGLDDPLQRRTGTEEMMDVLRDHLSGDSE